MTSQPQHRPRLFPIADFGHCPASRQHGGVESWDLEHLAAGRDTFDDAVRVTPDIDPFCSSSDWVLPATEAFAPGIRPWIQQTDSGFLAFVERRRRGQIIRHSLDPMWGFACPLIGPDPATSSVELLRALTAGESWHVVAVSGVVEGTAQFHTLVEAFGGSHRLFRGGEMSSHLASLEGGADGFLGRRSPKFRRNIRRAERAAAESGIDFEAAGAVDPAGADAIMERALRVEARSWKAERDGGIIDPRMQAFYRLVVRRLAPEGRLRAMFATAAGTDIGYILGGVRDGIYRGLQVSYDRDWAAASIGNLLQWNQIQSLVDEGATGYDLGMDMGYKASWSDTTFVTTTVIIRH